ncbi:MAG: CGNR zinc finger domain-containing protein [Nitrospiraceae bacterium]
MRDAQTDRPFVFVGNHLCLDFINTQMIQQGRLVDLLESFDDFVSWLFQASVLTAAEAAEAVRKWGGQREGRRTFEEAREFRAVLRGMAEQIVKGRSVPTAAIESINRLLGARLGYTQLACVRGRFERRSQSQTTQAIHLLVPIAQSASDLLCHCDLSLIKRCRNPTCILYFYDMTKNHARHWCSMNICGNRMKVAAHYRRTRSQRS